MFELIVELFAALDKANSIKVISGAKDFEEKLVAWKSAMNEALAIRREMLRQSVSGNNKKWAMFGPCGPYSQMVKEAIQAL